MRLKSIFLAHQNNNFHFVCLNFKSIRVASELNFNSMIFIEKIYK